MILLNHEEIKRCSNFLWCFVFGNSLILRFDQYGKIFANSRLTFSLFLFHLMYSPKLIYFYRNSGCAIEFNNLYSIQYKKVRRVSKLKICLACLFYIEVLIIKHLQGVHSCHLSSYKWIKYRKISQKGFKVFPI